MIFEIAASCGITLLLYLLLKRTLLRWQKQMEVRNEAQDGEKEEKKEREDDRPSEE